MIFVTHWLNLCVAKAFNVLGMKQDLGISNCSHKLQVREYPAHTDVFSGSELSYI